MSDNKLPIDDPRYRIEGTNMINFSKWSRENEPKPDHQFKVGDIVVLTMVVEITALTHDCDGTPLYSLDGNMHGYPEESLRRATDEEADSM